MKKANVVGIIPTIIISLSVVLFPAAHSSVLYFDDYDSDYTLHGFVSASDLQKTSTPSGWANRLVFYRLMDKSQSNYSTETCSDNISTAVDQINAWLSSGIKLNQSGTITGETYNVHFMCKLTNSTATWEFNQAVAPPYIPTIPPLSCSTTLPNSVTLGTITMGKTAQGSLSGSVLCNRDAKVKLSLIDASNSPSTQGILKVDDAIIEYDINGISQVVSISPEKNASKNFILNFTLTQTGKKAGEKKANMILRTEVQ